MAVLATKGLKIIMFMEIRNFYGYRKLQSKYIFKSGACRPVAGVPGFLKLLLYFCVHP